MRALVIHESLYGNTGSVRSRTAQMAKDRREAPDRDHAPDAEGPGVRELLELIPGAPGVHAAAFDTRLGSRFSGGAARGLARALRKAGAVPVGRPEGFIVTGLTGPLRAGELDRARAWGRELAAVLAASAPDGPDRSQPGVTDRARGA
jgi:hypothetical protein